MHLGGLQLLQKPVYELIASRPAAWQLRLVCNDVHLLQEHQNTKNHVICCSGWSGVDIWLWKVGFTPRPIGHGLPDRALSSSGAVKSLQEGLPSNAKLEKALSGRPCPGSMPKPYPFGASDSPLCRRGRSLGSQA